MIEPACKKTPLYDYYESLGYKAEQRNGSMDFYCFSSLNDEYDTLYNGVGLRDISTNAILVLTGNDVLDFLNRITTNSLKDLPSLSSVRTIFTTDKGRILDSVRVINFNSYKLIIGHKGCEQKLTGWINKYIINDDVKVQSADGNYTVFEVAGPQCNSFMTLLCGRQVEQFVDNLAIQINVEGISAYVLKFRDVNQEVKYLIITNPAEGMRLIDFALSNKGAFQFGLIGNDAYEVYRIEQGIPSGNELNDQYNPHEVRLLSEVSFTKGCYIGQEVIARLKTYDKVQKYLNGIIIENADAKVTGLQLVDVNGNEAGKITSTVYSGFLKKQIGLAVINKDYNNASAELFAVDTQSINKYKILVEDLPFRK